jgi:hypothetical protein
MADMKKEPLKISSSAQYPSRKPRKKRTMMATAIAARKILSIIPSFTCILFLPKGHPSFNLYDVEF